MSLPGSPPHQHPQNWQTLTDSTSWGSRTLIFPVLSFFFFFFLFLNNQICRKLAGAGRHWGVGEGRSIEKSPKFTQRFQVMVAEVGDEVRVCRFPNSPKNCFSKWLGKRSKWVPQYYR